MKITKEQFNRIYSKNVSKRDFDNIISKIDERFAEICGLILLKNPKRWFDYANCTYDSENSNGYFDPEEYKLEIPIGGEYANLPEPFQSYPDEDRDSCLENCFPTRWLWEDFEEEFKTRVDKYKLKILKDKEVAKNKRQELKNRKLEAKGAIRSKLSKEELKYVKFR